jgi:hypothetical protein
MSRKSSIPQDPKSVSVALMPDSSLREERLLSWNGSSRLIKVYVQISSLSGPPIKRSTPTVRKKGPLAGRKVAPKYRNPTNTKETWAGRGMKPKWLVTLKGGKKLESFAVKK